MRRDKDQLPQFQTDFLISWDYGEKDYPCLAVTRLRKDGCSIAADVIGCTHASSGCISIRQVLEEFENREREEADRAKHAKDLREALFKKEGEEFET